MVNAIVLIQTKHGQINNVAEQLADIPEISEVYSVGGSFDVSPSFACATMRTSQI